MLEFIELYLLLVLWEYCFVCNLLEFSDLFDFELLEGLRLFYDLWFGKFMFDVDFLFLLMFFI